MGNPPGIEERWIGEGNLFGFKTYVGEEVAGMVERHDDHDEPAEDVNGDDSLRVRRGDRRVGNGSGRCAGELSHGCPHPTMIDRRLHQHWPAAT